MRPSFMPYPHRFSHLDRSPYFYDSYLDHMPLPPRSGASSTSSNAGFADANRHLAELINALGNSLVKLNGKASSLFGHKEFWPQGLFNAID